jgi:hypothetical protein
MTQYPISKDLLSAFMSNFCGYGNLHSPYWFIGKEEGGGATLEENFQRVLAWESMGKTTTVDSMDYHLKLGYTDREMTRIQPTWTKLIQILLTLDGKGASKEERRDFQRHKLGRADSNHCLLELMPMASRSTSLWLCQSIFHDYYGYTDRKSYFSAVAPQRRRKLKSLIEEYAPKLVVFYSSQANYIAEWSLISGVITWNWQTANNHFKYGWAHQGNTLYMITPHPTSHGLTTEDFPLVGEFIKNYL